MHQLTRWIQANTPPGLDVLIPISGGTDSAFCFWLYNQVFPERTVGVYVGNNLRCESWFASVGTVRKIDPLPESFGDAELSRWMQFLNICLIEHRVLVGTRNKTEQSFGTFSHASRLAFHLPLLGLWKSEIIALCGKIGVPEEILASSRRSDPVCGRPAELAQIPFEAVDAFLKAKIRETIVEPQLDLTQKAYLETLYAQHHYKASLPLAPRK